MIQGLIGIVLGAALFASLLWSVYRAVVSKGLHRINAIVVSLATLMGMAGISYTSPTLVMIAAPACLLFGLAQIFTDPGWSKLLPLVQFMFGIVLFTILLYSGP